MAQTTNDGMSGGRSHLDSHGLSARTMDILLHSWSSGTKKQYYVYLNKWISFALEHNVDICTPSVGQVLDFLTFLFDNGASYSALNTARSALAVVVTLKDNSAGLGDHPLIKRFFKGVFKTRPSFPRYKQTWNVSTVLSYLRKKAPAKKLNLRDLSTKLVMLCFLVTGQRCQTIHLMDIDHMSRHRDHISFHITDIVKHSRPGMPQPELILPAFPPDRRLCVVTYLKEYLARTAGLRKDAKLFISYSKPHKHVTRSTLSRWVRTTLHLAGIDTAIFSAHSTRAASTSAAFSRNIPLSDIMKSAGWTQECTFSKFYNKPIANPTNFATAILMN